MFCKGSYNNQLRLCAQEKYLNTPAASPKMNFPTTLWCSGSCLGIHERNLNQSGISISLLTGVIASQMLMISALRA